jgi:hypothetical protein
MNEYHHHLSSNLLLVEKLDKAMILQAFRSKEQNCQQGALAAESLNKAQGFKCGVGHGQDLWEVICFFCENKGHLKQDCPKFKSLVA